METSKRGTELIKSFEQLRLKAYKPVKTEKYWTIGYGHYGSDVKSGQVITKEKADELFQQDLRTKAEGCVNRLVALLKSKGKALTQNKYDALVSFVFNVGVSNFDASTLRKKIINNADDVSIRNEFNRWVYCNGVRLDGLVRRRKAEAELYFN